MPRARSMQFKAKIRKIGVNPCIMEVPARVSQAFAAHAKAGRVVVEGSLNGSPFRATLVPTAGGRHRLYVNQGMRSRAGADVGDTVRVAVRPASSDLPIPPDVASILRHIPGAMPKFNAMPPSQRRELLRYIDDTRTDDQRRKRILKTAEHVLDKRRMGMAKESAAKTRARPLWTCPKCGNEFVNKNQWHSCKRRRIEDVFRGKPPEIRQLFDRFRGIVESCGPVKLLAYPNKVGFMARVRFAGAIPAKRWLDVGFWLTRRIEHPRFIKIETIAPNCHVYRVRVTRTEDFDRELIGWVREAYAAGCQKLLGA